jgi:hypothetical protein
VCIREEWDLLEEPVFFEKTGMLLGRPHNSQDYENFENSWVLSVYPSFTRIDHASREVWGIR